MMYAINMNLKKFHVKKKNSAIIPLQNDDNLNVISKFKYFFSK